MQDIVTFIPDNDKDFNPEVEAAIQDKLDEKKKHAIEFALFITKVCNGNITMPSTFMTWNELYDFFITYTNEPTIKNE
jgi:hypothetical protein